ncbi:DUF4926 domain-containing protein [Mycobacterium sp. 852002-51613_SCH5001154]|uniref:DUF4926 domain-containing protein n=1 Tax=Mycobacterium sp. 852002-51613_SCH5001154 TaxID=1834104 RepID=UPI003519D582
MTKGTGLRPQEFDAVQLLRPLPEHDLPAGARGTVVMEYTKYPRQNDRPAYEVELSDADGVTLALVTLVEDDVDVVWRPVEEK